MDRSEYIQRELLLQFLIGIVDAQLLEGVLGQLLEAEDVENGDLVRAPVAKALGRLRRGQALVDALDDLVEEPRVQELGERVTVDGGLRSKRAGR